MASTLTMPDSLDAVSDYDRDRVPTEADEDAILLKVHNAIAAEDQAAFDAEVAASDDLPGQEVDGAAILENITGQTIDQLADEAYGQAAESVNELASKPASEPTLDDAATPAPAPATRLSATDDLLIRIQNAEHDCRRCEGIVLACKEDLKSAKADYDSAVNKLRELASSVAEMTANDAGRPLLAVAEAAAISPSTPDEVSAEDTRAADAFESEVRDTSRDWPLNHVPQLVVCLVTDEKLKIAANDQYAVSIDTDGVCVDESTYLAAGEFRVIEWRDQQPEDVLPHFVEAFRAEQAIDAEAAASDDDSWRAFKICDLDDLSDGTVGALHNADIETVGQLADYTASGKLLTDIPKIGKGKAEQIENAMEKFWRERPDRKANA